MKISEESIEFLENHIPDIADAAFKQAYWQALATGSSVLVAEDGQIIEVFPDGGRKVIKQIAKPTKVNSFVANRSD
ncbi:MAG: hypothetical protein ABSB19_06790 [Methylomonas sp.]|jgi:hypothetical protein